MDFSTTLFIGDLSVYCTQQDLYNIFEPFGPIESIQLKRKATPDARPTYGFVTYRFRESAESAIRVMNGQVVSGRAIRIGWAEPPKVSIKVNPNKRDPPISTPSLAIQEMVDNGKMDSSQVHFSYVTNKIEPLREDVFRNVFQHFGLITDIRIKKSQYDPNKGVQTGYGFIHYPLNEQGITAALEAVKAVHELVVDSVKYSCRLGHMLEEFLKRQPQYSHVVPTRTPLPSSSSSQYLPPAPSADPTSMMYHNNRMQDQRIINPHSLPGSVHSGSYYPPQETYSTYSTPFSSLPSYSMPVRASNPSSNWIPPAPPLSTYKTYPSYTTSHYQQTERASLPVNFPSEVPSLPSFRTYSGISPSQSDDPLGIRTPPPTLSTTTTPPSAITVSGLNPTMTTYGPPPSLEMEGMIRNSDLNLTSSSTSNQLAKEEEEAEH